MPLQEILQYLMAVSLPVWLGVEEIIYRCGPSAVNVHEPLSAMSTLGTVTRRPHRGSA
jgi:DNA-binding IclR family transcriptional regulator